MALRCLQGLRAFSFALTQRRLDSRAALTAVVLAVWVGNTMVAASEPQSHAQDEQEIRRVAADYLAALAEGDSPKIRSFWTADGDVIDEFGRAFPVREAFAQDSRPAAGGQRPAIKLTNTSIRFLTSDVAIEDGVSEALPADSTRPPVHAGRFSVVWVKQQGKWRLASLREARLSPPSNVTRLAGLDWLVGDWEGKNGETLFEVSAEWNPTHTYLLRDLKVLRDGQVVFQGSQRIGWDPATGSIRSWVFDTDGGHGEGIWTNAGQEWIVQATGVLGDGRQTTSSTTYTPEGKDAFRWKTNGARTAGQPMPDLDIRVVRKGPST